MKLKSYLAVMLTILLVLIPLTASATQQVTNTTTTYLYDESTAESIIVDPSDFVQTVDNDLKVPKNQVVKEKDKDGDIQVRWAYEVLDRYDESNHIYDIKKNLVDTAYVSNGTDYPINGWFESNYSSSWSASGTVSGTTSSELNLMVAKVDAEITVGGTLSRSWTSGVQYGASASVPAHKIYAFSGYIPGTTTNGYAVYKLINDGDGTIIDYLYYPRGAIVPCENAWTIDVSEYGNA